MSDTSVSYPLHTLELRDIIDTIWDISKTPKNKYDITLVDKLGHSLAQLIGFNRSMGAESFRMPIGCHISEVEFISLRLSSAGVFPTMEFCETIMDLTPQGQLFNTLRSCLEKATSMSQSYEMAIAIHLARNNPDAGEVYSTSISYTDDDNCKSIKINYSTIL